jgi:hypothetical protein
MKKNEYSKHKSRNDSGNPFGGGDYDSMSTRELSVTDHGRVNISSPLPVSNYDVLHKVESRLKDE